MPFRERTTGPALQALLEAERRLFGWELEDDHRGPRAVLGGVPARSVVVPVQPTIDVTCYADVVTTWIVRAPEDVDEPLADPAHASTDCKAGADSRKPVGACAY
jgi:hypothetical protein